MTKEVGSIWNEFWSRKKQFGLEFPVAVDYQRLDEVIEEHTPKVFATTSHLPPIPGVGSKNPFVAASYILTGNIWNFHFKTPGHPPYRVANPENPEKPFEGFMAFWHKLYQHFGERVITADMLWPHVASVKAMAEFFHDLTDIPLPEFRKRCGHDFVNGLEGHYEGNSILILREVASLGEFRAFGSGCGLVEVLRKRFPIAYGEDHRVLDDRIYNFDKRARLAAMLFHQYALNSGGVMIAPLVDADKICPPIDYQLPRILHSPHIRVLEYSSKLDSAIEEGKEIYRGSVAEVAIRFGTAAALVYWMRKKKVPGWLLDSYLFSISRGLPNKAHYTKTSDY